MKKRFTALYYSFPIQLVIIHFRSNLLLVFLWLLLFSIVAGGFARNMGFHYLFLDPEYLGHVNFWSFFIVGITFGIFSVAWNATTYVLNSHRFPFLASLNRPFAKFTFNNGLVPFFFTVFYLVNIVQFQWYNEFVADYSILFYCLGFLAGLLSMLLLTTIYFQYTNKDIISYDQKKRLKLSKMLKSLVVKHRERQLQLAKHDPYKDAWRVDYFLTETFKLRIVRDVRHYNFELLERIFRQNHINAIVIQSISIAALILMGALVENPYFRIPTAASILILLSIITTIIGALTYWLQEWRTLFLLAIIFFVNKMMGLGWFYYANKGYGLDYKVPPTSYTYAKLDSLCNKEQYLKDFNNTEKILENWRKKFGTSRLLRKPRLVVICTSGGGLRASLFTMQALREIDKQLNGKLMKHTMLITGSSGGMLGAAYFRELYHQKQLGTSVDLQDPIYLENISKDIANAMSFTFIVNDIFIPWVNCNVNGYTYKQDRGYIFEQQLIENCGGLLGNDIAYYKEPEEKAIIPMMFVTPVLVNDGRQLVISPHKVSYMMRPPFLFEVEEELGEVDAVDFGALLENHNPYNMRFASALRMNATFPLFLPSAHLPTKPAMEVTDAGVRDNYGVEAMARFLTIYRNWIRKNTSGVTIIQIRANQKISKLPKRKIHGLMDAFNPISSILNVDNVQDFHHDNSIAYVKSKIGYDKVDIVRFMYSPSKLDEKASLSLHLTQREKNDILSALYLEGNQESLKKLKESIK
ncbi:MAG: patatin-like phospholipase family protein [Saprospiraceae bacterium]|nr:patatin-like phospholipase family protein [Saprospiraceae bacterium]